MFQRSIIYSTLGSSAPRRCSSAPLFTAMWVPVAQGDVPAHHYLQHSGLQRPTVMFQRSIIYITLGSNAPRRCSSAPLLTALWAPTPQGDVPTLHYLQHSWAPAPQGDVPALHNIITARSRRVEIRKLRPWSSYTGATATTFWKNFYHGAVLLSGRCRWANAPIYLESRQWKPAGSLRGLGFV